MNADEYLTKAIEMYQNKGEQYGHSYKQAGVLLCELFPNGITLKTKNDFSRFSIIVHIVGKLLRYCNNENGHIDSADDLIVYAAMLRELTYDYS